MPPAKSAAAGDAYGAAGQAYLSGSPGKRSWYANLLADPRLTVHLKQGVVADVPAVATPVTDEAERRAIFTEIIADLWELGRKVAAVPASGATRQIGKAA